MSSALGNVCFSQNAWKSFPFLFTFYLFVESISCSRSCVENRTRSPGGGRRLCGHLDAVSSLVLLGLRRSGWHGTLGEFTTDDATVWPLVWTDDHDGGSQHPCHFASLSWFCVCGEDVWDPFSWQRASVRYSSCSLLSRAAHQVLELSHLVAGRLCDQCLPVTPPVSATANRLFFLRVQLHSRSTCECDRRTSAFVFLTYFTEHSQVSFMLSKRSGFPFLWLTSARVCVSAIFAPSWTPQLCPCVGCCDQCCRGQGDADVAHRHTGSFPSLVCPGLGSVGHVESRFW